MCDHLGKHLENKATLMEPGLQGTKDKGTPQKPWLTETSLLSPIIKPSGEEVGQAPHSQSWAQPLTADANRNSLS